MGCLADLFVAGERGCVKKGLHGGLPEAVAALMRSGLVVFIDPEIKIGLKLSDSVVDPFAERDAVELVEQGLVEALHDTINRHDGTGTPKVLLTRLWSALMVRPSGTWGAGSTRVRAGRPLNHGLRARAFIWPPLRLARVR